MRWRRGHRYDRQGVRLADRHYSRRKHGSPQFVAPARNVVLVTPAGDALWVSRWPEPHLVKHAWPGAWECATFRNESPALSSELIREAVAATRWKWGDPPELGMITFVDPKKTRRKRDPGRCFVKAGFRRLKERTKKHGLVVLQLLPQDFPEAAAPIGGQLVLGPEAA